MRTMVLGGGYAGLVVASRLEDRLPEGDDLLLVDPRDSHLIRHELHRVIRRPDFAETITIPFADVLDRTEILLDRVEGVDTDRRTVTLAEGGEMDYDAAVVTFGAGPAFYGLEGVEEHSLTLDTPADAMAIGDRMRELVAGGSGRIVVGGGGLAGVQAAGELAQKREAEGVEDVSVTLVEQTDSVAPRFDPEFQARIHEALDALSVDVRTGVGVETAAAQSVELTDGTELAQDLFVWTGGIQGRSAFDGDRPQVRADLRLGESTFAAGDAVTIVDVNGTAVMPSAQTAIREARVASRNVERALEAERHGDSFRPRYDRYRDETFAWVVSVGDKAVAQVGPQVLTGQTAKALKSTVGFGYLSTAGSIRDAVGVVREEFGFAMPGSGLSFGRV